VSRPLKGNWPMIAAFAEELNARRNVFLNNDLQSVARVIVPQA
jgi:hypothetical protein